MRWFKASLGLAVFACSSAFVCSPAFAGVSWETETGSPGGVMQLNKGWAEGRNIRMGINEPEGTAGLASNAFGEVFFLGDATPVKTIVVNHAARTLFTDDGSVTRPETPVDAGAVDAAIAAKMADALAKLTPEQRAAVQQGLPGIAKTAQGTQAGVTRTVRRIADASSLTEPDGAVGGDLIAFEVLKGEARESVIWTAEASAIPGGDQLVSAFSGMKAHYGDHPERLFGPKTSNLVFELDQFDGRFPVAVQTLTPDGDVFVQTLVTKTEVSDLPDDAFTPPPYPESGVFKALQNR